jgi:DNA polymerase-3 subunit delta'
VLSRSHPDVHSVVPEGLSISVAEMRSVVGTAGRRPAMGRWQVVLIEDADRLTEQASNALLKAIEEPPPRTVFLLCAPSTHPEDVAVTIRSRCRLVGLRTPPATAVAQVLTESGIDPETASWAAQAGQGHVRPALGGVGHPGLAHVAVGLPGGRRSSGQLSGVRGRRHQRRTELG